MLDVETKSLGSEKVSTKLAVWPASSFVAATVPGVETPLLFTTRSVGEPKLTVGAAVSML